MKGKRWAALALAATLLLNNTAFSVPIFAEEAAVEQSAEEVEQVQEQPAETPQTEAQVIEAPQDPAPAQEPAAVPEAPEEEAAPEESASPDTQAAPAAEDTEAAEVSQTEAPSSEIKEEAEAAVETPAVSENTDAAEPESTASEPEPASEAVTEPAPETEVVSEAKTETESESEPETKAAETFMKGDLQTLGEGFQVKISFSENAGIPEGAFISAKEIKKEADEARYMQYLKAASAALDATAEELTQQAGQVRFFDLSIYKNKEEKLEPKAPVHVEMTFQAPSAFTEPSQWNVLHFADHKNADTVSEPEILKVDVKTAPPAEGEEEGGEQETAEKPLTTTVIFDTNGFSAFGFIYKEKKAPTLMKSAAPLKSPAANGEEEPYSLPLYGYNFGGLYKSRYSAAIVIGYPDDVKSSLTFENRSALKDIPFTYASSGLNVEKIGLIEEEENTFAAYKYKVIGFVPVSGSDISTADGYNSSYVFPSQAEAESFITSNTGVKYGDKPSEDMLNAMFEKEGLAVVWQQESPRGINYISLSATPTTAAMGAGKDFTLRTGYNALQKGDYSSNPIQVALTLDDGLTYSSDWTPSIADTAAFTIDPASIKVSDDRKTLSFNITEIKTDSSSYSYIPVDVKMDIADVNQTQDTVTMTAVNGWGKNASSRTASITINRPTIRTMLDDKANKALYFGQKDQPVTLKVEHSNAQSGATETHVRVAFPGLVTVKSAAADPSGKNTISNVVVKTEDGCSVVEYDVTNYVASSSKATDVIALVLDVKDKEDKDEEKDDTICTAVENKEKVLVTQDASLTVSDPYFQVVLYGPQDGWMDMSRGDGSASSTSRSLKFYGAADETALTMHKWTFDEDPIKGIYSADADGSVMIGPVVDNMYTSMQWKLVGFVPISYWSGVIRDRWDPLYGVYYLDDLDACKKLIEDNKGVLYGEAPTQEQAESLAQYRLSSGAAKVVCVWYIQEPPKDIPKKYTYSESSETVPQIHPGAYTPTSSGIDVQIESEGTTYQITFTIPEDYDGDIITLNTEFNDAAKPVIHGLQPGDKVTWKIKVIDKSGQYAYLKDSGAVGTIDYYNAEGFDYSVIGEGFEGYKIENSDEKPGGHSAKSRITRRGDNAAIRHLAEISELAISQNPTDVNVGRALYEIGYGAEGEGDDKKPAAGYAGSDGNPDYAKITQNLLDDYYLDYLNAFYYSMDDHKDEDPDTPHYSGFAVLSVAEYRSIFAGDTGTQVMETNPILAGAMYYGMYEQSILMSEEPEGVENYKGTYYWMHDWDPVTEGNAYEAVIFNQYEENTTDQGDGTVNHDLQWYQWILGTRNGNNMQDTYFGLAYQFKLVKKVRIKKVEKDHKDNDHTLTGAQFRLAMVDADGQETADQPLNLPYEAAVNDDGEIVFPALLPGRYLLQETKAPEGYLLTESSWYMNYDKTGKATFEAPSSLISAVTDQDGEVFNEFWAENEPNLPGDTEVSGTKVIENLSLKEGDFRFRLAASDGAPLRKEDGSEYTEADLSVSNDADGKFPFPKLFFTREELLDKETGKFADSRTYSYTVSEVIPDSPKPGVTYDKSVYRVDVTLENKRDADDENKLQVSQTISKTSGSGDKITFTNRYDASGSAELTGKKTFKNGSLKDGQFTFTVTDEKGKTVSTGRSDAKGNIAFTPIKYTLADLGGASSRTFTYTVKEDLPAGAKPDKNGKVIVKRVIYDTSAKTVEVTVTDAGDGTLKAVVSSAEALSFSNDQEKETEPATESKTEPTTEPKTEPTTEPKTEPPTEPDTETEKPVSIKLTASKVYKNGTLKAGDFTFTVKDENGAEVATGSAAANGSIAFSEIEYTTKDLEGQKTRTITYKISEDLPTAASSANSYTVKGVKYDSSVKTVKVQLTADAKGKLVSAVVTKDSGSVVFTNEKVPEKETEKPKTPTPGTSVKTGDNTPIGLYLALALAALAAGIGVVVFRRKKN